MRHVVMLSGGLSSYETAKRVVGRYGKDNVTLLFANTRAEDDDLHRFLKESTGYLGMPIDEVSDPQQRNPFDVFFDEGFLGNSRLAPCSKLLKQLPARLRLEERFDPADTIVYVGIKWDETHRIPGILSGYHHSRKGCRKKSLCKSLFTEKGRLTGPGCTNLLPEPEAWQVQFPLTEPPYYEHQTVVDELAAVGIAEPDMYREGYQHANCKGLCVRAGQAQWALTLKIHPDRFAYAEHEENRFRREKDPNAAILRDWKNGGRPLPLTEFRERVEASEREQPSFFDSADWGGCGCFTDAA
ncbi:hypothetical protein ACJ6WD_09490 [Streptomyces sp. VTCC 41912]|uniref:hypothetical protein n=1 Tax=Streptomyces TaxID=1883 RepID=UPI002F264E09